MAEDVMLESSSDAQIEPEVSAVDASLAELEKALGGDAAAKKAVTTPAEGTQTPAVVPATEAVVEKTPEQVLDEQLKGIEETKAEEKAPEPQLSADQKQVLDVFPTAAKASEVLTLANGYNNFTQAFAGGDFKGVDTMLERWNPEAVEGFREYVFDKYVRNGDWVDRWIAEKEGRAEENKDVRSLKSTVAKLQQQLDARKGEETTQAQSQQFQNIVNGFVQHVEGLFNVIKATDETDKKIIWSMVNSEVSGNAGLKQAILSGNYKAVNGAFKSASKTYYGKNSAALSSREAKQAAQATHKPGVQAGVMQELSSTLPDDIKDVPKGKEDAWLDQALGKLAAKVRRK